MGSIRLSRVYDRDPDPDPAGRTFLVERLWPRGVRRDAVHLDGWYKDVAPSTELRQWFNHDPAKWDESTAGGRPAAAEHLEVPTTHRSRPAARSQAT